MEATTQYGTAIVGGDFEKLRSLMDSDIMLMPPTASAIQGVDASIQYMQSGPPMEGSISAERIFGSGSQAYVRGNFNLTVNVNDSTQIENNGKFVEVWEKRNDGWKVVIDIWNSNAAADM
jgi:ketosteroid isomerase-like protein